MKSATVRLFAIWISTAVILTAAAQPGQAAEPNNYAKGIQAWKNGDLDSAADLLSKAAESSPQNPSVWYIKGVVAEQQGGDGTADFTRAAQLENQAFTLRGINRDLEPVQGKLRMKIERIRRTSKLAARPDDKLAAQKDAYRRGLNAMGLGEADAAISAFSEAIDAGTADPRPYFMRAVLKRQSGDEEGAVEDARQGIVRETSTRDIAAVDRALENVQGSLRVWLEKEVSLGSGDSEVTRVGHRRSVIETERQRQEQLLAANAQQQQALLAQQAAEDRARMEAAAARIAAGQAEAEELAELLAAPVESAVPEPNMPANNNVASANNAGSPGVAASTNAIPPGFGTPPSTNAIPPGFGTPSAASGATAIAPGPGGTIDVSWLPPSNEIVLYIRVADIMNSGFAKPLVDMPEVQQGLSQMAAEAGFQLGDIESVTVGLGDIQSIMGLVAGQMMNAGQGPPDPDAIMKNFVGSGKVVAVIRTSTPLNYDSLVAATNSEAKSFNGATYYLIPGQGDGPGDSAAYPVDAQTYVFGSEQAIQNAIQQGPGSANNPGLNFVPGNSSIAIAVASPMLAGLTAMIPNDPNSPPSSQQLIGALQGNLTAAAITVDASDDLTFSTRLVLQNDAAAGQAAQAMTTSIGETKQMYGAFQAMIPEQLQPIAQSAINSMKVEQQLPAVSSIIVIPGELVTTLKDSPEILGQLMMGAGAMGGPGGPGGFGPQGPGGGFGPPNGNGFPGGQPPQQ